jgi:hypothetical protein
MPDYTWYVRGKDIPSVHAQLDRILGIKKKEETSLIGARVGRIYIPPCEDYYDVLMTWSDKEIPDFEIVRRRREATREFYYKQNVHV